MEQTSHQQLQAYRPFLYILHVSLHTSHPRLYGRVRVIYTLRAKGCSPHLTVKWTHAHLHQGRQKTPGRAPGRGPGTPCPPRDPTGGPWRSCAAPSPAAAGRRLPPSSPQLCLPSAAPTPLLNCILIDWWMMSRWHFCPPEGGTKKEKQRGHQLLHWAGRVSGCPCTMGDRAIMALHLVAGTHPAPTPQCLLRQLTGLSQGSNLGTGFWYRVEQTFGLRKDRNHLDCPPRLL